jgi:hypothetical protein
MTKRELIDGYRLLSDKDRRVFHRWLIGNIVVGTIAVIGLIAITISVSDSSLTPDQRIAMFQQSGLYP